MTSKSLTPETRLRGRSRFVVAKARHLLALGDPLGRHPEGEEGTPETVL